MGGTGGTAGTTTTTMTTALGPMRPSWFSMHQARAMLQYYFGDRLGAYRSTLQAEEFSDAVVGFVGMLDRKEFDLGPTADYLRSLLHVV